jgi:hypothetical protein
MPPQDAHTPIAITHFGAGIWSVQMVVYGLGMGLTSAPATESIVGAISRRMAGVGSAVNDTARLIGGTLGVAVIGSIYASVSGSRLTATLPAAVPGPVAVAAAGGPAGSRVAARSAPQYRGDSGRWCQDGRPFRDRVTG